MAVGGMQSQPPVTREMTVLLHRLPFGLRRVIVGELPDQSSTARKAGKRQISLSKPPSIRIVLKNHLFLGVRRYEDTSSWLRGTFRCFVALCVIACLKRRVSVEMERIWKKKLV